MGKGRVGCFSFDSRGITVNRVRTDVVGPEADYLTHYLTLIVLMSNTVH